MASAESDPEKVDSVIDSEELVVLEQDSELSSSSLSELVSSSSSTSSADPCSASLSDESTKSASLIAMEEVRVQFWGLVSSGLFAHFWRFG